MARENAMNRFQNSAASAYSRFDALYEDAEFVAPTVADRMGITGTVQVVASALVLILLIVYVLNEVFNAVDPETDVDGNYIGPFGGVIDDLETTGVAALGLLVIAVLVVAAGAIMRMFGGSGFGTR